MAQVRAESDGKQASTRAGAVTRFDANIDGEWATVTVWDAIDVQKGDVIEGDLKRGDEYRGRQQYSFKPHKRADSQGSAAPPSGGNGGGGRRPAPSRPSLPDLLSMMEFTWASLSFIPEAQPRTSALITVTLAALDGKVECFDEKKKAAPASASGGQSEERVAALKQRAKEYAGGDAGVATEAIKATFAALGVDSKPFAELTDEEYEKFWSALEVDIPF